MSAGLSGPILFGTVLVAALALVAVSASGAIWLRGQAAGAARLVALLGLAAGVLVGDALLHLLPHAWAERGAAPTLLLAVAGFGLFAAVDRLRASRHAPASADGRWSSLRIGTVLMVDALHHLLDGVILAIAFSASPVLGFATWIALLAHELPKEWGELAMLVAAGRHLGQAIKLNLAAAAPLLVGAGLGLVWGQGANESLEWLGAVVAGGFLYLSLFLLLPALQRLRRAAVVPLRAPWRTMACGLFAMGLLAFAEQRLGLGHGHVHGFDEAPPEPPRSFAPWGPRG
jgi:zinc and cadmium transporter